VPAIAAAVDKVFVDAKAQHLSDETIRKVRQPPNERCESRHERKRPIPLDGNAKPQTARANWSRYLESLLGLAGVEGGIRIGSGRRQEGVEFSVTVCVFVRVFPNGRRIRASRE